MKPQDVKELLRSKMGNHLRLEEVEKKEEEGGGY